MKNNKVLKLPLPESIISWKGVVHNEEVIDDPSKHEGRIRSFKHERGNWATLVYIDYMPNEDLIHWLENVILQTIGKGNFFEELHVSLTRTLILKYHWIDSFVEAVKNVATTHQSFIMELSDIKVYCNEDKSRTFMGVTVDSANNSLKVLSQILDKQLIAYRLPTFYEDASHHLSFCWFLGNQIETLETFLPIIKKSFYEFLINCPEQRFSHISKVNCKIGNKLYSWNLK
ncbi:U6 snRNA phosphodiesterase 1 isoform X2 [Phymastichus coffea]|nr:U6 snRNA phosphodiesterase 1 isoform X2 [Phymastichus coffea]